MTTKHDETYLDLVSYVLENGVYKPDRTGVGVYSIFDYQMTFDLSDGTIPLLTTKKMHTRSIIHELLWYLRGDTNIKYLNDNGVTIWDEWADSIGNLGPVYGHQWRDWSSYELVESDIVDLDGEPLHCRATVSEHHVDQIANLIETLKNNPNDRRMIVSAWNVGQLHQMRLPPCHYSFQCYAKPVDDTYELSLKIHQRSCDVGLGVPFNIVQYSILLRMIAEVVGMRPGKLIWDGGDIHIYQNHISALDQQLQRTSTGAPTLSFARRISDIDDFQYDDFVITNYHPHPKITMDVAV